MTPIGIFAKTFNRESLLEILQAAKSEGFDLIQFNMSCVGLPSLPDHIPENTLVEIQQAVAETDLKMAGLSATFNMSHPDPKVRQAGLASLEVLAKAAPMMGTELLSLCTGSRHPVDKWAFHPDNTSSAAWLDMCLTMEKALIIAEQHNIFLGIEPELGNIVSNAPKAQQLLSEMKSDRLKVILDPANLFEETSLRQMKYFIAESIDLLAPAIAMTHAKDRDGVGGFVAPGRGLIPFDYFVRRLAEAGVTAPMVAHGFREEEVPGVADFLLGLG